MSRASVSLAAVLLLLSASAPRALAEGRTVFGTVERVSAAEGSLTIKDAAGVSWSYKADPDSGIDLSGIRAGDRVAVTVARPTPLNMISPADRLRKGDRVEKAGR
ncbi:MAG: hypothetical protein H6Q84_450 [Deltaproteobacteria bacterium]|nr:hypothetical protein [Deltaproteobacteria bacterium]